jgi:hypothetical protein
MPKVQWKEEKMSNAATNQPVPLIPPPAEWNHFASAQVFQLKDGTLAQVLTDDFRKEVDSLIAENKRLRVGINDIRRKAEFDYGIRDATKEILAMACALLHTT